MPQLLDRNAADIALNELADLFLRGQAGEHIRNPLFQSRIGGKRGPLGGPLVGVHLPGSQDRNDVQHRSQRKTAHQILGTHESKIPRN